MEERFLYCNSCGNLLITAIASGIIPYCCGDEMTLLKPNTHEGNKEKHIPVVTYTSRNSMKINVGSEPHPMTREHNIRFVYVETTVEGIIHYLAEDDPPEVTICFSGKPIAIYAYCNVHGLWKADAPTCEAEKDNKK